MFLACRGVKLNSYLLKPQMGLLCQPRMMDEYGAMVE
jgi:hypothetical protein